MDVAVVVALYNGAEWIRSTLDSVMSQTHSPSEVIVVDDGSTDGSPDIVAEEYPEARLVENDGEGGPCQTRNYGVGHARTEYVAFLDQDDQWHEDHLKLLHETLQAAPDCVVAYSNVARFSTSEPPDYSLDSDDPASYDPWDDYPYDGLGETIGGVIRRDAFEKVEGWSPEVEGGGVHHLWLKLGLIGDFAVTGYRTAAKREHDEQFSENFRQHQAESYLETIVKASEDALRRRRERGLDTEQFLSRLDAQKALLAFLRAAKNDDRSEMERSLKNFGESMADEPQAVIQGMWGYFWWHVKPVFEQRGITRSAADLLGCTRQWPNSLQQPRDFLQEWAMARASSAELVRRYPMVPQYWSLFARRGIDTLRSV